MLAHTESTDSIPVAATPDGSHVGAAAGSCSHKSFPWQRQLPQVRGGEGLPFAQTLIDPLSQYKTAGLWPGTAA